MAFTPSLPVELQFEPKIDLAQVLLNRSMIEFANDETAAQLVSASNHNVSAH
jgi:hypothetical protein